MVTAREIVAELMGEKNCKQGQSKREALDESGGVFIEKRKSASEFFSRRRLVLRVGASKMRACGKASAKRQQKQQNGEEQGLLWRAAKVLG